MKSCVDATGHFVGWSCMEPRSLDVTDPYTQNPEAKTPNCRYPKHPNPETLNLKSLPNPTTPTPLPKKKTLTNNYKNRYPRSP